MLTFKLMYTNILFRQNIFIIKGVFSKNILKIELTCIALRHSNVHFPVGCYFKHDYSRIL